MKVSCICKGCYALKSSLTHFITLWSSQQFQEEALLSFHLEASGKWDTGKCINVPNVTCKSTSHWHIYSSWGHFWCRFCYSETTHEIRYGGILLKLKLNHCYTRHHFWLHWIHGSFRGTNISSLWILKIVFGRNSKEPTFPPCLKTMWFS